MIAIVLPALVFILLDIFMTTAQLKDNFCVLGKV